MGPTAIFSDIHANMQALEAVLLDARTLGAPALDRSAALKDRVAPGFTLTDIDGESRSLADYAGKKRLLVAFSSW